MSVVFPGLCQESDAAMHCQRFCSCCSFYMVIEIVALTLSDIECPRQGPCESCSMMLHGIRYRQVGVINPFRPRRGSPPSFHREGPGVFYDPCRALLTVAISLCIFVPIDRHHRGDVVRELVMLARRCVGCNLRFLLLSVRPRGKVGEVVRAVAVHSIHPAPPQIISPQHARLETLKERLQARDTRCDDAQALHRLRHEHHRPHHECPVVGTGRAILIDQLANDCSQDPTQLQYSSRGHTHILTLSVMRSTKI